MTPAAARARSRSGPSSRPGGGEAARRGPLAGAANEPATTWIRDTRRPWRCSASTARTRSRSSDRATRTIVRVGRQPSAAVAQVEQRRRERRVRVRPDRGQGVEQPAVAVDVGRQVRLLPAAVVERQVDAATGGKDVVGDRARGLHGQFETCLRRLADDAGRGAVEHDGDVAALGVVHLAQHEAAGLGRGLPVDVVERLAGLVRRGCRGTRSPPCARCRAGPRPRRAPRSAKRAHEREIDEARVDGDVERLGRRGAADVSGRAGLRRGPTAPADGGCRAAPTAARLRARAPAASPGWETRRLRRARSSRLRHWAA